MNGYQMSSFLSLDKYTSQYFGGFVLRDSKVLPLKEKKEVFYILNTDVESGNGEHWCVAFFTENNCEFFDSYGMDPSVYNFDEVLSSRNSGSFVYNPFCVQDLFSKVCGHHCLFFAFHKCRGYSFDTIIRMYDFTDIKKNDEMVLKFVVQFGNCYNPMG